ncbi:MAG: D-alanyl-D-alanine carboxypeptidase, partial [Burkholderiaceae bacterium]
DINTLSNNTMARTMFLNLSANEGSPGTLEKSRRLLSNWFHDFGIGSKDLTIDNGSGLSRVTKLTPADVNTLLFEAAFSKEFQVWKNSLALAGKEGTTANRFRGMDVSGNAWLKTGSLDNVQAYAGYILTETKRWISFAILINHRVAERAKLPLDRFVDSLYRDSKPQLLVEGSKQVK